VSIHQIDQADTPDGINKSRLEQYFELVLDAFKHTQAISGRIDTQYQMGRFNVRLCFAGSALVPKLSPAFDHLVVKQEYRPSLTINLWDSESTGTYLPEPLWEMGERMYQGEMWVADTERYKYMYQPGEGYLRLLDLTRNEAILWTADASKIPYYETGAPLKMILNWWMGNRANQIIHAGAVGMNGSGVLLVGKGGSGKSTTALVCLDSGLDYLSDDYCMVANESVPYAYSLYCSGKINAEDFERFPNFMPALSNGEHLNSEKALFFFNKLFPQQLVRGFPIKAILIPKVTDRIETTLTMVSPAESYLAIAPSTIFQLRGIRQPMHEHIAGFVRKLPSYRLELGQEISKIPGVIQNCISRI
jgi:hypothetical protein